MVLGVVPDMSVTGGWPLGPCVDPSPCPCAPKSFISIEEEEEEEP